MPDFLTLLPPEIRNAIYKYALLRSEVYPYEYGSSVHAETSSLSRHEPQIISDNRSTAGSTSQVGNTRMPRTVNARLDPPSTALLCTCKRFQLEATAMVYTGNTFVFFDPKSCQCFYDNAPRQLLNAVTHIRLDPWLFGFRGYQDTIHSTRRIIDILGGRQDVKHLQLLFRTFGPARDDASGRFARSEIFFNLDERWHLSSGVDMLKVDEDLCNETKEVLFDYQHLLDVECEGLSVRGHGTVKLFLNGSKTLEWEQACA